MLRRILALVALLPLFVVLGTTSCTAVGDECSPGEAECGGPTTIRRCTGSHDAVGAHYYFDESPCPNGRACVTPRTGKAACALSAERVPECASDGSRCVSGEVVTCTDGFPVAPIAETCGGACLEAPAGYGDSCAFCNKDGDAVADPACRPGVDSVCVDGAVQRCACGYRTGPQEACASAELCVSAQSGRAVEALCVLSAAPDPKCGSDPTGAYCDATGLVTCKDGYAVEHEACACQPNDGSPYCTYPDASVP